MPKGRPFTFTLGVGQVIQGWDQGVRGMRIGGRRTLHIPAHLGYGDQGAGVAIPPRARLNFEVEVIGMK
jgi:FKBP-type peptidyl-prolyl cis-trans isomerase